MGSILRYLTDEPIMLRTKSFSTKLQKSQKSRREIKFHKQFRQPPPFKRKGWRIFIYFPKQPRMLTFLAYSLSGTKRNKVSPINMQKNIKTGKQGKLFTPVEA